MNGNMGFFAEVDEENVVRSLVRQGHTHEESSCYYGGQKCRSFGRVYAGHASPKKHRVFITF